MKEDNKELIRENLVVVFDNLFHKNTIPNLTQKEQDLLYGLICKIKSKGLSEIVISQEEMKLYTGEKETRNERVVSLVDSLWSKIKMTDYKLYAKTKKGNMLKAGGVLLFSYLTIDDKTGAIHLQLNPSLEYFFNGFENGYTSLSLCDFQRTKNRYGKALFSLLSQYKSTGFYTETVDSLMYKLDVPKTYGMNRFNTIVLKPAMESVAPYFDNLTVEKEKSGRKIVRYKFHFTPQESKREWDPGFRNKKAKEIIDAEFTDIINQEGSSSDLTSDSYSSLPTKKFMSLLKSIKIEKIINADYFERNNEAIKQIAKLYRVKVENDPGNTLWNDMTFLASLLYLIKNDEPIVKWAIENAHLNVSKGNRLDIESSIYIKVEELLDSHKSECLYNFVKRGEII